MDARMGAISAQARATPISSTSMMTTRRSRAGVSQAAGRSMRNSCRTRPTGRSRCRTAVTTSPAKTIIVSSMRIPRVRA